MSDHITGSGDPDSLSDVMMHRLLDLAREAAGEGAAVRRLVVLSGSLAGETLDLPADGCISLGRREGCDLRFDPTADPTVSGRHAELRLAGGRATLVDSGSKNGTRLAGRTLEAEAPLAPGDVFQLGAGGPEIVYLDEG